VSYPISGCVFIRNCFVGAFCAFESMASMLPFVDEFVVLDLGSTDGTLHYLRMIADANPKVRLEHGTFPKIDAGAFATLANDLVGMCSNEAVWYCQADEIPHQGLLRFVDEAFARGEFDWTFWRIQYHNNFQYVKWFPHLVHRVGIKGQFKFNGDGMSTSRTWEARLCSDYNGGYFTQWGEMGQEGIKPYVDNMIMDVSLLGGFRDNIIERRAKHAPFWHEEPTVPYFDPQTYQQASVPASAWAERAMSDPDWTRAESPYNLPPIMRWHVGRTKYELRPEILDALKNNTTEALIGL